MNKSQLSKFTIQEVNKSPEKEQVSAVFVFAFNEEREILATKNERGWDIPGGHLEPLEELSEALQREVLEETSTTIKDVRLKFLVSFAQLENAKKMAFYIAHVDKVLPFKSNNDVYERDFLLPDELLKIYNGGEYELFQKLLQKLNLI